MILNLGFTGASAPDFYGSINLKVNSMNYTMALVALLFLAALLAEIEVKKTKPRRR